MGIALAAAVVGVLSPFNGSAATLARLDPVSLRPAGPRVLLGEYHDAWGFSPDGSQVALGNGGQGRVCGRGVCVVEARSGTIVRTTRPPPREHDLDILGR